mgnify:CR=1 FL=1
MHVVGSTPAQTAWPLRTRAARHDRGSPQAFRHLAGRRSDEPGACGGRARRSDRRPSGHAARSRGRRDDRHGVPNQQRAGSARSKRIVRTDAIITTMATAQRTYLEMREPRLCARRGLTIPPSESSTPQTALPSGAFSFRGRPEIPLGRPARLDRRADSLTPRQRCRLDLVDDGQGNPRRVFRAAAGCRRWDRDRVCSVSSTSSPDAGLEDISSPSLRKPRGG